MHLSDVSGLVADVGGTNTRLARVNADGVIAETVKSVPNDSANSFLELVTRYIGDGPNPDHVIIAVAGPVDGRHADLTNRDWAFDADQLERDLGASRVAMINDLEALAQALPTIPDSSVSALHDGAHAGQEGQAIVVGLGTGFNVAGVDIQSQQTFITELGHACLPARVQDLMRERVQDASPFTSVENLFSGVGMMNLAKVMGIDAPNAGAIATSEDAHCKLAVDIVTDAFALMVREIAYMYFPRAGLYFNGSMARTLLNPERRDRVLAPLRADHSFKGQFARLPAYLLVSDTVALGGCAARLLAEVKAGK